jgi:pyruvate kinase
MHRERNTKILATLGPASSSLKEIRALHDAGADAFRLNFSHGEHIEHKNRFDIIRELEREIGRPIAILADLQGPKIRIGDLAEEPVLLESGAQFRLDNKATLGDRSRAPLPHREVLGAVREGSDILIDDGRIRLRVQACGTDYVDTVVIDGGELRSRKGVNVPDVVLPVAAMTDKDRRDLDFALELGVDWVALSFVQRPEDVAEARKIVSGRAAVMAKIEKPAALNNIQEIVDLADGIMVARGDLGVELPVEYVPGQQKRLIQQARLAGKPVVVATQMLESMVTMPVPTRAEVSDVAAAIYDLTDAVMLSAETAAGSYPVAAVDVMDRVARQVERDRLYLDVLDKDSIKAEETAADAITLAARQVAETIHAAAIVTYTTSGSTAIRASRERPQNPIVALTPRIDTARRLTLAWGLHCVETEDASNFADMVAKAVKIVRDDSIADPGTRIVITAGVPFGTPGATNILRIAWVPED